MLVLSQPSIEPRTLGIGQRQERVGLWRLLNAVPKRHRQFQALGSRELQKLIQVDLSHTRSLGQGSSSGKGLVPL